MTLDKIKSVATVYKQELAVHISGRSTEDPEDCDLCHAVWMLEELQTFDSIDKANRWLGFVQGVLWTTGVHTIDEMRDHNRSETP